MMSGLAGTQADAPDIDCVVYITAPETNPLTPLAGKIVPVQMVAAAGYDLAGVVRGSFIGARVSLFFYGTNFSLRFVGENTSFYCEMVAVP
jgi:hypothetical protein